MTLDSRVWEPHPAGAGISAKGWCDGAPPAAQAAQRRAAAIRRARTRELYRLIRPEGDDFPRLARAFSFPRARGRGGRGRWVLLCACEWYWALAAALPCGARARDCAFS